MKRLENKIVFLTGGAQGIGAEIARLFVKKGAKVALADVKKESLEELVKELNQENEAAAHYIIDITNKAAVQDAVNNIYNKWGRIDVLINNAGITRDALTAKMTESQWDDVIKVNLTAPFLCAQAVFPIMKEQAEGVIINASSVSSLGNVGQSNYSASKAGIIALTKTWALEFARYNIRVNAIAPGFTDTPMIQSVPEKIREAIIEKIPLKRFGHPEEIAYAYCFLASDEAKFITGHVLFVDGGLTCGF